MPSPTRSPHLILFLGPVAVLAACIAPREGYVGTTDEFAEMVTGGGAEPVEGALTETEIDPADQPPPEPTAEDVASSAT